MTQYLFAYVINIIQPLAQGVLPVVQSPLTARQHA